MCGIVGIISSRKHSSRDLLTTLKKIQHRGYDGYGMTLSDNGEVATYQNNGRIVIDGTNRFFDYGVGHTRYKTYGDVMLCQPISKDKFTLVHNGQVKPIGDVGMDSETILNILEKEIKGISHKDIVKGIEKVFETVEGSYSCILLIKDVGLVAFRDLYGIRPLSYSEDNNKIVIASETVALEKTKTEIKSGEIVIFMKDGSITSYRSTYYDLRPCLFEYIYFAHPSSIINNISVREARVSFGSTLAKRLSWDVDLVIPVPNSSCIAAKALANHSGIEYYNVLEVNGGRTFILPTQEAREKAVKAKFKLKEGTVLKDKNILIVDDSIVRGTTLRYVIKLLKNHGADKIYLASIAPPVRYENYYGIDLPSKEELLAHSKTDQEVAVKLGAHGILYQNLQEMEAVLFNLSGIGKYENSIFTGNYLSGLGGYSE